MKAFFFTTCMLLSAVAANLGSAGAGEDVARPDAQKTQTIAASAWQIGFAQADITPRPGQAMMAGFGRERYAEGALAPLRAQVLVFQDEAGRRAMLCTADVLGFGPDTVEVLRHRIQTKHGLAPADVCLAASHTHWGPAINFRTNFLIGAPNVWYLAFLEETVVRLAGEAIQDLAPATMSFGECDVQIGACRRLLDDNGKVRWAPNPAGGYDRHTPILQIVREKSPRRLIVVGHACHPTATGSVAKWSPEYPGAMRDRLEAATDDCRALFVMGCGGDTKVTVKDPKTGQDVFANSPEESRVAGEKLADQVLDRLRGNPLVALPATLHTGSVNGSLSFQQGPSREEIVKMALGGEPRADRTWWARQNMVYPDDRRALDYEVQAWRLGPLTLVALEGEVCSDWGGMTRALAPAGPVMVVAYANRCQGYIPTARIVREGGYEGDTSHTVYFLPAPFEPKVESELTELIRRALGRHDREAAMVTPN